jgi:hypothetical protein
MVALRLVRLIEAHSNELSLGLLNKIHNSPCASDLLKVPADELHERTHEIYRNLSDWLVCRTEEDIKRTYTELGSRRASQGVAFSHFFWAVVASKEQLWDFMETQRMADEALDLFGHLELLRKIDHFFDRALYYAARAYEQQTLEATLAQTGQSG